MQKALIILVALSVLSFILAVLQAVSGLEIFGVAAEGYSRACSNFALIAIALAVCFKSK